MRTSSLEKQLQGCRHINLKRLAAEHFSPAYLESTANSLLTGAEMTANIAGRMGMPIGYELTEETKCAVHHSARELIGDLWAHSLPTVRRFVKADKRFDLDKAESDGLIDPPFKGDLQDNLNAGQQFIATTTNDLFGAWLAGLKQRYEKDNHDPMAVMYMLYRAYSILITGGDREEPSILERTFTSAGRETFDWTRDYPGLSREQLEKIMTDSRRGILAPADGLAIQSASREEALREATARGELAYVFDPSSRKVIYNPKLLPLAEREERVRMPHYYDKTNLVLQCPAKFAPSDLYPGGSMLHDVARFRDSVYTELYLATHDKR